MATTSTDCNPNDIKLAERINEKLSELNNIDEVSSFFEDYFRPNKAKNNPFTRR